MGSPTKAISQPRIRASAAFSLNMGTRSNFVSEPRLTDDEEKELLRQAVEMRRLTTLRTEMTTSLRKPLVLDLAMAAGYGEELGAYEDAIVDGQQARDLLVTRNM